MVGARDIPAQSTLERDVRQAVEVERREDATRGAKAGVLLQEEFPSTSSAVEDSTRWRGHVETASVLSVLAFFAILGVLIRYALEEAFGCRGLSVMQEWSTLFKDLPANAVGCYFMGVIAFGMKDRINGFHELLFLGLSTGLLGSITTYASWNQDMVELLVADEWPSGIIGLLIGVELPVMSLIVGISSGWALNALLNRRYPPQLPSKAAPAEPSWQGRKALLWSTGFFWLLVFTPAAILGAIYDTGSIHRRQVWLACAICPLGVWARWRLSKLNGTWSTVEEFAWIPLGTLLTNMIACLIESVMAVIDDAVDGYATTLWTKAVMIGVLGCMSTVSTFALELYRLHESKAPWRAYAYCLVSVLFSQAFSMLVYGIPVWKQHYYKAYPPWSKYAVGRGAGT